MLKRFLTRQIPWSQQTFGEGYKPQGIIDHIRSELIEIEKAPDDLEEWIDVIHLALDGAVRCLGKLPIDVLIDRVIKMLFFKQRKNFKRQWQPADENGHCRHVKGIHD